MSTTTQVPPKDTTPANPSDVVAPAVVPSAVNKEISVMYDGNYAVTVDTENVDKNTTVRFVTPNGGKVRIVFLSPTGQATDTLLDSEWRKLTVGGIYHFECFFTPKGWDREIKGTTGGVLGVVPPRP
jgi:hypothetical protein